MVDVHLRLVAFWSGAFLPEGWPSFRCYHMIFSGS